MKTPALLLGAALIFWGWQTGLWIIALPMALVFEGSRLIRLRWDLSAADFRRVSDLCTILFIVLLLYFLMSDGSTNFIIVLLKCLPVVFFPLLAAQAYATSDRIDMRALFLIMRKKKQKVGNKKRITLNLTCPYFAICILSASTANVRGVSFYVGFFVLLTLTFWFVRSKRFSPVVWICLLAIAGSLGVVGFTMDKVTFRLSNIMAFDADVFGNWGCRPAYYPAVVEKVLSRKINLLDNIEE